MPNQQPMLPIPMSMNLPHIALGLGLSDCNFQPKTMAIIDTATATALSMGNADYHLKITESYPQLVKSIIWAKDQYSPISQHLFLPRTMSTRLLVPKLDQIVRDLTKC
jgi:hypothetical protein